MRSPSDLSGEKIGELGELLKKDFPAWATAPTFYL
jgi:hypothetical protein